MQFMQKPTRAEQIRAGAQAICDREGQVLFTHAAPLGLSAGDFVTDRMTAAERRFLNDLPPDMDVLCLCRSTVVLWMRRPFSGLLGQLRPLAAPPPAVAAAADLARAMGLVLSPRIEAKTGAADAAAEAAAAELIRLCVAGLPPAADSLPAERLFHQLCALPPLCARQLELVPAAGISLGGAWPVILYCLAAFLCRSTDGSPLRASVVGGQELPVVLISAVAPAAVPPGRSRLSILADRFADAPELAVCSRLAARSGIEIEVSTDQTGRLGFAAAQSHDPALLGLKQPVGFSGAAEEAAEAEWCRLLRAAVRAER